MTQAYPHFGTGSEPRQTIQTVARHKPPCRAYVQGDAMPSSWQVRHAGQWYRVWYVWRGPEQGRYQAHFIRNAAGRQIAAVQIKESGNA